MFHNIKVDIVYYRTNTDFEMEFNLCGCCRMRLLTDKSPDKKTMVNSLARAVSRSQVIFVVGNLFGDDGIIKTVAQAIKYNLTVMDNKTYKITSEEDIEIIDGSVPLVTDTGIFGGLIIESGKQTIILLSDSKNVRKPIMTSLVHPYIEELCMNDISSSIPVKNEEKEADDEFDTEDVPLASSQTDEDVPELEKETLLFNHPEIEFFNSEDDDTGAFIFNDDIVASSFSKEDLTLDMTNFQTEEQSEPSDDLSEDNIDNIIPISKFSSKISGENSEYDDDDENAFSMLIDPDEQALTKAEKRIKVLNTIIFVTTIVILVSLAVLLFVTLRCGMDPFVFISKTFITMLSPDYRILT